MKVAVVGIGSVGRRHLGNLLRLGIDDIIAVSEHNRLDELSIENRRVPVCHDFGCALAGRPDAVVVANPTHLHLDYLRRAIDAGCHVYLEMPAATTATGLASVASEAARRRLVVAMGTMYRFNARLESLRRRILGGAVGKVLSVEALIGEHIADYHPGEDYRQSYTARAALGGGVLLTQIHQIDWLLWTFGTFDSVFAAGGHRTDLDLDVEDSVSYLLRGSDGASAYGHLDYLQRPKRAGITVTGMGGRLEWDLFAHKLTFQPADNTAEPEIETSPYDRNAMFVAGMADFLDSIRSGGTPRSTLEDGRRALVVVDAIKASMRSGQAEPIAP
jgi:predicted dehydrogenase